MAVPWRVHFAMWTLFCGRPGNGIRPTTRSDGYSRTSRTASRWPFKVNVVSGISSFVPSGENSANRISFHCGPVMTFSMASVFSVAL